MKFVRQTEFAALSLIVRLVSFIVQIRKPEGMTRYRPEIDGLRAIAVIAVVLFHADIGRFSGGYVGVDVFFVISGYLITQIISSELAAGSFSIARFYERRIRRIAPPLLAMLALTLIGGYWLLLPDQYLGTANAAFATEAFVSNILFYHQSGYFAQAGGVNPMLHTWSLAVEEQFYLFFPIFMIFLHRLALERLKIILIILFAGSLALASIAVFYFPTATFYLFPARAWELLTGALLAVGAVPNSAPQRRWLRETEAALGLALIAIAVVFYTDETPFPGASALPPALGAALIIHANADEQTLVGRLLSLRPIVFVGLISYALYLFHWPIFTFLRQYLLTPALSGPSALLGVALSGALAALSLYIIERPFRDRRKMARGVVYACVAVAMLAVSGLAAVVHEKSGWPDRFSQESLALAQGARSFDARGKACLNLALEAALSSRDCRIGTRAAPTFVVYGDSHSAALLPAFDEMARAAGRSGQLVALMSCPPGIGREAGWGGATPSDRTTCRQRNADVLTFVLRSPSIDTVILSAYWNGYERSYGDKTYGRKTRAGIERVTARLIRAGKHVIILTGIPDFNADVPSVLAWRAQRGQPLAISQATHSDRFERFFSRLAQRRHIHVVSLHALFCKQGRCRSQIGGNALFTDGNHPSAYAARLFIAPYLIKHKIL
ncbi:MAG TPA: acyltransferase family protein [Beijerinckiaceae bacterium]|nr:acyltransferase family protein [Beijerinckiaceae bacterium]HVB89434.1 acyltransferase family protein [Beijerinckiaceae bacterium]